jgi:type IV secretory pathway TrbD component
MIFQTPIACVTCQTNMAAGGGDAAGYSIFFLLIVILAVLGGVIFFMARMMRREQASLDPALQDEYVRPTSSNHS